MAKVAVNYVGNIEELIKKYGNSKNIIEVIVRDKNKRYKAFYKVAAENLKKNEAAEKLAGIANGINANGKKLDNAINILNKNANALGNIGEAVNKNAAMLGKIAKLNQLNLVLGGANLCATCVGFAIMYAKLDKVTGKIDTIVNELKKDQGIQADYEFRKVLSEYSNMLDCRKKKNLYTEDQMRKLVADEYNVIRLLISHFEKETTDNRDELLYAILSLSEMLSASLKYFDECYYFANKEAIGNGKVWHNDHDTWLSAFDELSSDLFVEKLQDHGLFELKLNVSETDCYYINVIDQIRFLKQEVIDYQALIEEFDNQELLDSYNEAMNTEFVSDVNKACEESGLDVKLIEEAIQAVTAA